MKSVLSIKKTVLSVFMILMLAMTMVGCGSSSSKSDADVAKEKAAEVLALAQGVDVALENEEVGFEALMENVERASAKYDEFLNFMDEKNIEGDDALEANEKIEEALALMEEYNAAVASIEAVREAIEALSEEITAADAAAVAAAREAYDALENAGYQAKVDIAKLEEAEEAIAGLNNEAIEAVEELIEGLIDAEDVTFENLEEVAAAYIAAQEKFDALDAASQDKVDTAKLDALEAKLTEIGKEVKEVAAIDDITIAAGEELVLPETVEVTLYMNTKVDLKVEWDLKDFDNKLEEEYVITGTIVTGDDYNNTLGLVATVKVTVTADVVAPIITLNGNAKVVIKLEDTYEDKGATALDNVDGDLTDKIEVENDVDTAVEETYVVTYVVEDAAGNIGTAERTVIVDGTAPVITLNGEAEVTVVEGSSYEEAGATAEDEVSGDVDVDVAGEVDVDVAGVYTITYTAVDEAGNEATVTRTVTVKVTVVEALRVESVSAINLSGVTVVFEAVKEAQENVTIEVKDPDGKVVEVKPLNLEVGDTEVTFDFVEEQKEEALVGVWKVNGVEYNFDVIKQLADIKEEAATPVNEIKFLAALNAAGIKNVDENRLGEYAEALVEKDEEIETLEDVQAIIDEVNKGEATKEEQDAAVKAVKEAKNQIQLLAALEAGFERVNADWIVEYATDSTNGLLEKDNLTFEGIQNAVDVINKEKVEEKITAAEAKLDSKLVSEAKTLVENYIKEDGKNETTKKGMLDQLAIHQAVINVNLANTNNKLDAAFKALAELVEDTVFDIETVKPELLKAYRDAIAEEAKKETLANKTAENIQTIVSAVNQEAAEAEAALKINFSVASDGGTNADVDVNVDNLNTDKRLVTVTGDYLALEEYKANNDTPPATAKWIGLVIGLQDKDNANITGKIKLTLDGDDVREVELGKLDGQAKNEFWYYFVPEAGGNTKTLDFEVKDAEGKVVQKDGFTIKFVDELSDEGALVMMNEAEDANAMRVAMSEMAALAETPIANYINLSSAAKLEVAEIVLAAREKATDKKFAQVSDATTAITDNVTAYTGFLTGVNTADSINGMNTALDKVVFPEFQKLLASEKIAKAELVLNALNELRAELEDPTAEFETIAEIKAAAGL